MARKQKASRRTKSRRPNRPPGAGRLAQWVSRLTARHGAVLQRLVLCLVLGAAILVGGAAAFSAMKRSVLQHRAQGGAVRYRVALANRPDWMPDALAGEIARSLRPRTRGFDDPALCRAVHDQAAANPWIADVREVRRVRPEGKNSSSGVVRVTAAFRQPIAQVQQGQRVWFVDARGVVLPYHQAPKYAAAFKRDGHTVWRYFSRRENLPPAADAQFIHYIVIQGVAGEPPAPGKRWRGEDLAAGLRLVRLVRPQPWSNQITVADVRNHKRRETNTEAEYRLFAYLQVSGDPSRRTDIRFGRFPHPDGGSWVISPQRKVEYLDRYVEKNGGRLAGLHEYIDLRYDQLRTSVN